MRTLQSDLQHAQSDPQSADSLGPFSPQITKIDDSMNTAVASGIKGANAALADMQNANYAAISSNAIPLFAEMNNAFNEAQQLAAVWKVNNQ